ncbi:hypothetical protein [Lentilactobacillus sp. Marseille-Q4993]|uniref:hypothetical protein n=1 Tax=Lentilactobacillus sp. Marseille-Q4993 TaxID=3039492 RepID=UPI0024BC8A80|nr:hypothetical protein [Lentilactobacillus sp. Marseille-Q4993]
MPIKNNDDTEPLTRKQYRERQRQGERKAAPKPRREPDVVSDDQSGDDIPSRQPQTSTEAEDFKTPKWHRTNRRLNWIIGVLLVLVLIVYLILFFIN